MREEYYLKTLKVKRHGILPSLEGQSPEQAQVKITITLDDDLVDYYNLFLSIYKNISLFDTIIFLYKDTITIRNVKL
jgi:hypothetical protein